MFDPSKINNKFPVLAYSSISTNISKIKYQLQLKGLEDYQVNKKEAMRIFLK